MDPDNLTPEHITTALHEIGVRGTTESINKTIIEYDIIAASTLQTLYLDRSTVIFSNGLIQLVNLRIKEGWSPIGGLTWDGKSLYQAIVKYG
jgi:hypothetical protein